MRLLLFFVDGIGLGQNNEDNPFYYSCTPGLGYLLEGGLFTEESTNFEGRRASLLSLDASLGVPGLPQSATGQAALFTGINAPAFAGKHINGLPGSRLRRLIALKSVFKQLTNRHYRSVFANAYRPRFFDSLRRGLPGNRYSCSTLSAFYGNLSFYGLEDVKSGKTLYMDITGEVLKKMNYDLPLISPEEGAKRLVKLSRGFDFCLFEYFLSDLVGHLGDRCEAENVVSILDRFIFTLGSLIDPRKEMLIVTSDHGNLENLSIHGHTLNRVPALLVGDRALRKQVVPRLHDLTDLLPAFMYILKVNPA